MVVINKGLASSQPQFGLEAHGLGPHVFLTSFDYRPVNSQAALQHINLPALAGTACSGSVDFMDVGAVLPPATPSPSPPPFSPSPPASSPTYATPTSYDNCMVLDANLGFLLRWNYRPADGLIDLAMQKDGDSGWLGIGFTVTERLNYLKRFPSHAICFLATIVERHEYDSRNALLMLLPKVLPFC